MSITPLARLATLDVDSLGPEWLDVAANVAVSAALDADDMRGFHILTDSELDALSSDVDTFVSLADVADLDPYVDWTDADWDAYGDDVLGAWL